MNITDISLLKPTVKMKATNSSYAIYGHIVSSIGGFFAIVSGLMNLFNKPIGAIIGLIAGIIILMVEFDQLPVPLLKEAQYRAICWFILAVVSFGLHFLAIILIFVGGGFYLAYDYQ